MKKRKIHLQLKNAQTFELENIFQQYYNNIIR